MLHVIEPHMSSGYEHVYTRICMLHVYIAEVTPVVYRFLQPLIVFNIPVKSLLSHIVYKPHCNGNRST